jgi:hypothetical protein
MSLAVAKRSKSTLVTSGPTTAIATVDTFADTLDRLFEPVRVETLASLLAEYQARRDEVAQIAGFFDGPLVTTMPYFIRGNLEPERYSTAQQMAERLFSLKGAVAALDAEFWDRAMDLTDVRDAMPQKRRDEWAKDINEHTTQPFTPDTVLLTLQGLLAMRKKFFGERVAGVFEALSPDHKTNKAAGFSKILILNYVWNGWMVESSAAGYINDLRSVIARFMGRDEPNQWRATEPVIKAALEQRGQWLMVDAGSLRIRCYKKGTAHVEIHPLMAWRLNNVLASIYPNAIASEVRVKPTRQPKGFELFGRPLPFKVIEVLNRGDVRTEDGEWTFSRAYHDSDVGKAVLAEVGRVIEAIGGTRKRDDRDTWTLDYSPKEVIQSIVITGCIPDHVAHQYYPTPENLAARVVAEAEIEDHHECLEPSAGQGAIAGLMPLDKTICVEVSDLHCQILRAKGHRVAKADFLKWKPRKRFDRVVMNPPFSEARWPAHLEHAASLLAPGGRLVAVLPKGARNRKGLLAGWSKRWSEDIEGEFAGTSAVVVILTAEREQE